MTNENPPICKAFNLTVSTRDDISDEAVKAIKKWVTKNVKWYHVVLENETSKRHLHAVLYFEEGRDKKKIRENIWDRQVKPFHPTSVGRVAVHLQACPGRKWISEYLHKEETVEVVCSALPEELDDLDDYYPTEEVQEQLMAAKDKVVDVFYSTHEIAYKAWLYENTWVSSSQTAHEYFMYRMNVVRDMRVIADSRRVHQMAVALHKYCTQTYKLTNLEIATHVKENCANDYSGV